MSALPAALLPWPTYWRTLPWQAAALAFLMMMAGAAALLLGHARTAIAEEASGRVTIGVIAPDVARREAIVARVGALLEREPAAASVSRVPDAEVHRLAGGTLARAPLLPALIDVRLKAGANPATLATRLHSVPAARVQPAATALTPLSRLATTLRWLALAALVAVGALAAVAAMLVARATLVGEAATLALLGDLGATDMQIARLIERRAVLEALAGAIAGSVVAATALIAAGARMAPVIGPETPLLGPRDWGLLGLLPFAISAIAMAATRIAVLRQLRRDP